MHHTCLKKFVEVVPSCVLTDRLEVALDLFGAGDHDRLVIVDEKQCPTGLLRLHDLFPYVLSTSFTSQPEPDTTIDLHKHLSELKPPLLEPLATLPAHLTLHQAWATLQQIPLPFALVDESGRFLGLLNSRRLIQFLKDATHQPAQTILPFRQAAQYPLPSPTTPPNSNMLRPLVQLLEQMPLPLMLQTGTGQAIAQNSAWFKQVGEILDPAWVGRDAAAQFARQSQGAVSNSPKPRIEGAVLPSLCQLGTEPNTCICICPMKNGQERALQFVKIPLGKTLFESASVVEWVSANDEAGEFEEATEYEHFQLAALLDDRDKNRHYGSASTYLSTIAKPTKIGKSPRFAATVQPLEETLWLVMAQDVTEQQQLARELTAKNADLIQLNRLKDEFLACISHELKTPLTAVLGLSTLLKDQAIGALNHRQSRYAQLIYQSGRHLMMVVNDILDLTRMETGQLELVLEPVQIATICTRAIEQARQLKLSEDKASQPTEVPGITNESPFLLNIEPGLDTIVADDLRLRQMLINLLSNALKFTEIGGELGLKVSRWAGWIAFTVWDTGIGIPADKQHLIFQKFQQLENPLTRRFEGTGLGLVLTQRLARLHGGDVTFTSKEGEGSQFTLLLPPSPPRSESLSRVNVQAPTAAARSTTSIAPPPPTSNGLILVVEAVPRYVDELNQQLAELGYLVVIARSGTEALEKARRLQPRVIFLNPLLPLLSGWDVLTLLKADAATRYIPTVVTATRAEREQAHRNQAEGFLNLPIQAELLQQTLDRLTIDEPTPAVVSKSVPANLAVLRLRVNSLEETEAPPPSQFDLNSLLHAHHYRVLEADDLEQAELLARVWKPRVVLLDGSLPDPLAYLQQLSQLAFLASLPIVTLDQSVTEAANQISGLSVFPCLVELSPDTETNTSQASALLQAIQVATGFAWRPLILTADTLLMPDLALGDRDLLTESALQQGEWLQALMQYVQTAGYRSLLGHSWTEVLRQLQHQNADLLLLCWHSEAANPAMVKAITNLQRLASKPPILLLDYSHLPKQPSHPLSSHLPDAIRELANRVLPAAIAIPDLLDHIQQALQ